jgi:hypothetical protein
LIQDGPLAGHYPILYDPGSGRWKTGALGTCAAPTLQFFCASGAFQLMGPAATYTPDSFTCNALFALYGHVDLSSCGGTTADIVIINQTV